MLRNRLNEEMATDENVQLWNVILYCDSVQCDSVAWPRLSISERIIVMAVDNFFGLGVLKISIKAGIPQRMVMNSILITVLICEACFC